MLVDVAGELHDVRHRIGVFMHMTERRGRVGSFVTPMYKQLKSPRLPLLNIADRVNCSETFKGKGPISRPDYLF